MRPTKAIIYQVKSKKGTKEFISKKLLKMYLQKENLLDDGYEVSIIHNSPPFTHIQYGDVFIDTKSLQELTQANTKTNNATVTGQQMMFYIAFGTTNSDIRKYAIEVATDYSWIKFNIELKPTVWETLTEIKPLKPDITLSPEEFMVNHINAFVTCWIMRQTNN